MRKTLFLSIALLLVLSVVAAVLMTVPTGPLPSGESEKDIKASAQKHVEIPELCQYPYLPTGCEVTAASMVLQFYGSDMTPEKFALHWLSKDENFYYIDGELYGPDPRKIFAGDPFKNNSYGCFAPVIAKAVNNNSEEFKAEVIRGKSVEELCEEYIDKNCPLLIWVTMGMRESASGSSWKLEDGSVFTWTAGEHCMVLCGYNEEYYYLADPQSGSTVLYKKDIVEKRFKELGRQALYIRRG